MEMRGVSQEEGEGRQMGGVLETLHDGFAEQTCSFMKIAGFFGARGLLVMEMNATDLLFPPTPKLSFDTTSGFKTRKSP